MMRVLPTSIPEVALIEPKVYGDTRGFFFESFNERQFSEIIGQNVRFVQDNHSRSSRGVLRGVHYQVRHTQGKLVRVVSGAVFDVAVDLRRSSPTYGSYVGEILTAENKRMLWVPEGFGHAFLVLSDNADFLYKTTDYYDPDAERCIRWDDPDLDIRWPLEELEDVEVKLSQKDREGLQFREAEVFA
jgi:dTDP-4-dehydrorhamnose 3,5-epimerase